MVLGIYVDGIFFIALFTFDTWWHDKCQTRSHRRNEFHWQKRHQTHTQLIHGIHTALFAPIEWILRFDYYVDCECRLIRLNKMLEWAFRLHQNVDSSKHIHWPNSSSNVSRRWRGYGERREWRQCAILEWIWTHIYVSLKSNHSEHHRLSSHL